MGRPRLRKRHVYRFDRRKVMHLIALGFDKKRILKETDISERSYYLVRSEFDALPEAEKAKILAEAKVSYDERIFDHDYWFRWDYLHHKGESKIPIIQKWVDTMILRDVKEEPMIGRIRRMHDICYGVIGRGKQKRRLRPTRIAPQNFTEDDGLDWILLLKKEGKDDSAHRLTIRNFLKFGKGVEPTRISGKKGASYGSMAREYFRDEEREAIFHVLAHGDTTLRDVLEPYMLKYGMAIAELTYALYVQTKFLFHTMTRLKASCRMRGKFNEGFGFETVKVRDKTVMRVTLRDKGRKGKDVWTKPLVKEMRDDIEKYGLRDGRMFPFKYYDLRVILKEVYKKAGITRRIRQPAHIWRHTGAMYYLRKTGWNYAFVQMIGGWVNDSVLKECYGKPETKDMVALLGEA